MKPIALFVLTATVAITLAQEPRDSISKPKPRAPATVDLATPVSQAEARAVFARASTVMKPVLGRNFGTPSIPSATKPVTRGQVILELGRMFDAAKPAFKFTPVKVKYDPKRLTLTNPAQKTQAMRLIEFGAAAKLGPLVAGNRDSLTIKEFGDAVGFFIARMAELTHMPSRKWTPGLQP
ncbi:MAG TPA: hypothetical protein VGE01_01330 [Fimbriimonas sp.]